MAGALPKQTTTRAVAWSKYDRADWKRLPGKGRYYYNVNNPNAVITRRQFDEHYGAAAEFGSYERKAKKNSTKEEQLLRPARGRKSALKIAPELKNAELNKRKVIKAETAHDRKVQRLQAKHDRIPKSISLRNFGNKKAIRKFRTPVSREAIETIRAAGERSRIVFGYWVGLEIVSERDNRVLTPTCFAQRDIREPFTEEDFLKALQMANVKNYATLTGMWIALHLTRAASIKNGVKLQQR